MKLTLDARAPHRIAADLLVVVVPREGLGRLGRDRLVGSAAARELGRRGFKAEQGTASLIVAGAHGVRRHVAIVGLGAAAQAGRDAWRRAGVQMLARAREVRAKRVVVAVRGPATALGTDGVERLGVFAEGALLASYRFDGYRKERQPAAATSVTFAEHAADRSHRRTLREAEALATATNRSRTWINEPAAVMTPAALASDVSKVARAAGLDVRVDGPKGIAALGMGALLGVSRGSAEEPRFIRLT